MELVPSNWKESENILKVIGVGGGGTNAVNYMYNLGIDYIDFVVCNTDFQHLNASPVPVKIQLGPIITKGLGAGTDSMVGEKAARESAEEIRNVIQGKTEMVFITCGMGGGTGTGAAPVIAEIAKSLSKVVVGVVTIPSRDEGPEAMYRATEGIRELKKSVDSLLIIDNEKLYQIYEDLDFFDALPKADEVLCTAVKSITEIISRRGYINVDMADIKKVMKDSGMALMGRGEGKGANRNEDAVNMALKSPLLEDVNLSTATKMLVNITASGAKGGFTAGDRNEISELIKQHTHNNITCKVGIVKDDEMGEGVCITIIVTGFEMNPLPQIDEDLINPSTTIAVKMEETDDAISVKHGLPQQPDLKSTITRRKRILEVPSLIVSSGEEISKMETEPAFYRRERILKEREQA